MWCREEGDPQVLHELLMCSGGGGHQLVDDVGVRHCVLKPCSEEVGFPPLMTVIEVEGCVELLEVVSWTFCLIIVCEQSSSFLGQGLGLL